MFSRYFQHSLDEKAKFLKRMRLLVENYLSNKNGFDFIPINQYDTDADIVMDFCVKMGIKVALLRKFFRNKNAKSVKVPEIIKHLIFNNFIPFKEITARTPPPVVCQSSFPEDVCPKSFLGDSPRAKGKNGKRRVERQEEVNDIKRNAYSKIYQLFKLLKSCGVDLNGLSKDTILKMVIEISGNRLTQKCMLAMAYDAIAKCVISKKNVSVSKDAFKELNAIVPFNKFNKLLILEIIFKNDANALSYILDEGFDATLLTPKEFVDIVLATDDSNSIVYLLKGGFDINLLSSADVMKIISVTKCSNAMSYILKAGFDINRLSSVDVIQIISITKCSNAVSNILKAGYDVNRLSSADVMKIISVTKSSNSVSYILEAGFNINRLSSVDVIQIISITKCSNAMSYILKAGFDINRLSSADVMKIISVTKCSNAVSYILESGFNATLFTIKQCIDVVLATDSNSISYLNKVGIDFYQLIMKMSLNYRMSFSLGLLKISH